MQRLNGGRKIDKRRRIGEVKSGELTKTVVYFNYIFTVASE